MDLPTFIQSEEGSINITYDADGNRLKKIETNSEEVSVSTVYMGQMEYVNDERSSLYHEGGRIMYNVDLPDEAGIGSQDYVEWNISDHLGNTRLRYIDKDGDGSITTNRFNEKVNEVSGSYHYYPYGMVMEGNFYVHQGTDENYQYNGIEHSMVLGSSVGLTTFRVHDAAIGGWWQVDPDAEMYAGLTPYNSMLNNPVLHNDPKGDNPLLIGAATGLLSNGIGNLVNGQNFFHGGMQAAAFGAFGGGISAGIGSAAQGLANTGANPFGVGLFQAGAHALSGGILSSAQGGSFWSGAASGSFSSITGSVIASADGGSYAQWIGGGLSGGVGSMIAGGSFWEGAGQGLITGGLNHAADQLEFLLTKRKLIELLKKEGRCVQCTDQEVGEIFQNEIVAPSLILEGIPIIPGEKWQTLWGNTIPDFFFIREGTLGTRDITGVIEVKAKYSGRSVGLFSQNGQIFKQLLGLSGYMASKGYSGGKHAIITTGGVKVSGRIRTFGRGLGIKVHHIQAKYTGSLSSGNIIFR